MDYNFPKVSKGAIVTITNLHWDDGYDFPDKIVLVVGKDILVEQNPNNIDTELVNLSVISFLNKQYGWYYSWKGKDCYKIKIS